MIMSIHHNWKMWYKYICPRRLTVKTNPAIYRWLIFVIKINHY